MIKGDLSGSLDDNTSAVAAMVKGYSKAIDSVLIVHAFHCLNIGLRADVFFEYVRSEANIADAPSRGDTAGMLQVLSNHFAVTPRRVRALMPSAQAWTWTPAQWIAYATRRMNRRALSRQRPRLARPDSPELDMSPVDSFNMV